MKSAETAEIEARQAVDIRKQEAEQAVGQRTAEKDKAVGIAVEQSRQEVLAQEAVTSERDMAVKRVQQVRQAEITKEQEVVAAEQDKQTRVIKADGLLEAKRKEATGIELEGIARGEAEKAMKLAPVSAQIELAKEIGANPGYQQYLAMIEAISGYVQVGNKQAEALKDADVKVIANTGKATEGLGNAMDLFTSKGGTELGSMIEAFAQTPLGKLALAKLGVADSATPAAPGDTSRSDPSVKPRGGPEK